MNTLRTACCIALVAAPTFAQFPEGTTPEDSIPEYTVRFVGEGTPTAVNSLGQAVGNAGGRAWIANPGGEPILLPLPTGATSSSATDANSRGWVIGTASGVDFGTKAVLWKPSGPGTWTSAVLPVATDSDFGASAVNDLGDVIGWAQGLGVFAYSEADGVTLLFPFGFSATVTDVNDERVAVGRGFFGGGVSIDLDTFVVTDIGLPTGTGTNYKAFDLNGTNEAGDLCGRGVVATSLPDDDQAVRFDAGDGLWTALNSPYPQAIAFDLDAAGNTLFSVGFSSPPYVYFDRVGTYDLNTRLVPEDDHWSVGLATGGHISDNGYVLVTGGSGETGQSGVLVLEPDCGSYAYGLDADGNHTATLWSDSIPSVGSTLQFQAAPFPADGVGLVAISSAPASLPGIFGGTVLVDLASLVRVDPLSIAGGLGEITLPIPNNPNLAGVSLFAQAFGIDAPAPGGWAFSSGLEVVFCP